VPYPQRSAVEMSIEKYEKTAMQWLQEQTKNKIANDIRKIQDKSPADPRGRMMRWRT